MPANPYDAIIKELLPGKPLDASTIAAATGTKTTVTVAYLSDLLKRGFVTYDGNPMGFYAITEAGRLFAAQSVEIPFEILQEQLEQPKPAITSASYEFIAGQATLGTKATFACGCIAFRAHPASDVLMTLLSPCEAHSDMLPNA